jgi:hypothetical protein
VPLISTFEVDVNFRGGREWVAGYEERFQGGLVLKARGLLYHSGLCSMLIKKTKKYRGVTLNVA